MMDFLDWSLLASLADGIFTPNDESPNNLPLEAIEVLIIVRPAQNPSVIQSKLADSLALSSKPNKTKAAFRKTGSSS